MEIGIAISTTTIQKAVATAPPATLSYYRTPDGFYYRTPDGSRYIAL